MKKMVKKGGSGRMNNVHFISYLEVFVIRVISGKRGFLISWRWRLLCLLALRTFRELGACRFDLFFALWLIVV